ncbi:flavin reductase family protein [Pseudonocardia sp. MH-G8]|uniref:flavin reductase family protein n=1 Tax=Pseudonocardia sp. MH-G8 TaxID=1854588 RepID=UPI000BA18ED7|nr:flavin reductase family protein [Pseudonocardia sp. MH-G8]OZM77080.1 oxidoreductase [Pseudonocardia sp. MH-G8]
MTVAPPASAVPDQHTFRTVMGVFATGVAVITTEVEGAPQGMTINSLTSLSVAPPMLLACLEEGSRTAEAVTRRGAFVINLLTRGQTPLSDRFSRLGQDHFEGLAVDRTDSGLPALPGSGGRIECEVDAVHPGGDHVIVVGRVLACTAAPTSPLVFYRGRYHRLGSAGHDVALSG